MVPQLVLGGLASGHHNQRQAKAFCPDALFLEPNRKVSYDILGPRSCVSQIRILQLQATHSQISKGGLETKVADAFHIDYSQAQFDSLLSTHELRKINCHITIMTCSILIPDNLIIHTYLKAMVSRRGPIEVIVVVKTNLGVLAIGYSRLLYHQSVVAGL
jgi:hypothetical protein